MVNIAYMIYQFTWCFGVAPECYGLVPVFKCNSNLVQRGQQTSRTDTIYKLAKAVLNLNFSRRLCYFSVTISAKTHAEASRIRRNVPTEFRNSPDIENPNSLKKFCRIMDNCKDNRTQIDRGMDDDLRGANYSIL
ncbi:hypothetical protein CTI12_AA564700 [Artemisia annua]|uniref:Uncharacterized protein n=1 Tax=Artemisia annua TaxID=35608 RepID=A0A2U1KTF3_ARTAN|nr:hypothetical protein CTI12_AA564700 [Artemisia annua]